MRVVFSDSEPDLNDERDESTDDANATKRSPSHLGSKTNPVINDDSSNSNDDDLRGASESNDAIPSAISSNRDPGNCKSSIQSDDNTLSPIEGSKTVKRKASNGGISPHNIISPSARASNESLSQNDGEPPGKLRRLTRGHGRSTVSYDMKHHPMDDVLRPKFSLKRRANRNPIPDDSSDSDEEIDGDDTNDAPSGKVTSSNPHCRRSSRKVHQSQTPIYSAKWHPLDQMLRDNASLTSVSKKDGRSKKIRANTSDSSSMAKDEEGSMTVNSDLNLDQDAAAGLEGGTVPISPDRRRSTRISSTNAPPNYDMKYGDPTRRTVHIKANYLLQISYDGFYHSSKGCCKAIEVHARLTFDTPHLKQSLQPVGNLRNDSYQKASKSFPKVLTKACNRP